MTRAIGVLLLTSLRSHPARAMRRVQLRGGARSPGARRSRSTLSARARAPTKQMGLIIALALVIADLEGAAALAVRHGPCGMRRPARVHAAVKRLIEGEVVERSRMIQTSSQNRGAGRPCGGVAARLEVEAERVVARVGSPLRMRSKRPGRPPRSCGQSRHSKNSSAGFIGDVGIVASARGRG